jgi:hypothetical protein
MEMIKIVCIKSIGDIFLKNQCYSAVYIDFSKKHECYNEPEENYIDVFSLDKQIAFYIDIPYQEWRKFSDYFLTFAEWRDNQINSILDGDD